MTRLAREQRGIVSRAQLLEAGVGVTTIRDWLASGRLLTVFRGVYAVSYRRTDPQSHAQAALLACGEHAALARGTAAVLWGINERWPCRPQLVGTARRRRSGLEHRYSGTLIRRDITVVQGLRVTSPARTLLDMAPQLTRRQLERGIDGLRVRRLLTTAALSDVAERNRSHPGTPLLERQLGVGQHEPTRSALESAFMEMVREYKLPVPELNVHVCGYRVDAYYRSHQLIVELDGWTTHQTRAAFERDRRQDAEILTRAGIPTVRFTYDRTLLERTATADQLRSILAARNNAA